MSHAPEWEGLTDHCPIWSKYAIHNPAQSAPKQANPQKVHWELKLTDRQKVDEFVESMENYDDEHPCPMDKSTMASIQEYMRSLESHATRTVKRLYRRAGLEEQRSEHKDGWSLVFISYKAHLTALILIRRHLLGHTGNKNGGGQPTSVATSGTFFLNGKARWLLLVSARKESEQSTNAQAGLYGGGSKRTNCPL